MTDSCAGACCAVFPIHKNTGIFNQKGPLAGESAYIMDMLIPLTRRQALARSRRLGYPDPPKYGVNYSLYTCKHWDEESRLCGAYESRPKMCSAYPYGRACERGCGYESPPAKTEGWEWDAAAAGWRPTSTSAFLWDAENGLLKPIPTETPNA